MNGWTYVPGLLGSLKRQSTQSAQEWASTMVAMSARVAEATRVERKSIMRFVCDRCVVEEDGVGGRTLVINRLVREVR